MKKLRVLLVIVFLGAVYGCERRSCTCVGWDGQSQTFNIGPGEQCKDFEGILDSDCSED